MRHIPVLITFMYMSRRHSNTSTQKFSQGRFLKHAAMYNVRHILQPCTAAIYCSHVLQPCTAAIYCSHVLQPCTAAMYCSHVLQPCTLQPCTAMYYHVQPCTAMYCSHVRCSHVRCSHVHCTAYACVSDQPQQHNKADSMTRHTTQHFHHVCR
jgi:hypothetical protein